MTLTRCLRLRVTTKPNPAPSSYSLSRLTLLHTRTSASSTTFPLKNTLQQYQFQRDESRRLSLNLKPPIFSVFDSVSDTYKCNILIKDLGLHGRVLEARKVFDEMPHRDDVSYASMINAYLKNSDLPRAEQLFLKMPLKNVFAESAMIDGYAKAGSVDKARRIFDCMSHRNVFSWTSLISGYFKVGNVDEASQLFDRMPVKNVVSWTIALTGYASNGFIDQAREMFDQMPERNVVSWTAMIKAYVEIDRIDEAFELFHVMPQRNLYSWNIMISGFLDAKRVDEAIQLFNSMPQKNMISWTAVVTGLARNQRIEDAREYFDRMPNKDIASWNAMITAYIDEGVMSEANMLFNTMPEKNIVTWNALIDGHARHGTDGEALRQLVSMLWSGLRPNEATITSVLTSCRSMLELMQAHALVVLLGFEHDTSLMNALVTMYSKSGDIAAAKLTFTLIEFKDVISWTAMILVCSHHGLGYDALNVFARMLKSDAKPDQITFVGILSACSHAGLVIKGQSIFYAMSRAYPLRPKAEHYSCLVDILGRAGQVKAAMKVIDEMPPSECDVAVLGALLGAFRVHGDPGMVDRVGEKLIELEPTSSGGYVLLANAYAARGEWDKFARVRKLMKERDVKKVPGFSQIDMKGKSHVFFSGDKSHPQLQEIYTLLLEQLLPIMQEMGYTKGNSPLAVV